MPRERIYSPCGSKLIAKHGYKVENGERVFGKIGEVNMREKINASLVGSTLYEMIEKYQKTGDDSFLMAKAQSFDIDLTTMPKSLIELYNVKTTCKDDFYKFPVDFRALFDHDVNKYFVSIQDNTIEDKMKSYFESKGKVIEKPIEEIEEEEKKDELVK